MVLMVAHKKKGRGEKPPPNKQPHQRERTPNRQGRKDERDERTETANGRAQRAGPGKTPPGKKEPAQKGRTETRQPQAAKARKEKGGKETAAEAGKKEATQRRAARKRQRRRAAAERERQGTQRARPERRERNPTNHQTGGGGAGDPEGKATNSGRQDPATKKERPKNETTERKAEANTTNTPKKQKTNTASRTQASPRTAHLLCAHEDKPAPAPRAFSIFIKLKLFAWFI